MCKHIQGWSQFKSEETVHQLQGALNWQCLSSPYSLVSCSVSCQMWEFPPRRSKLNAPSSQLAWVSLDQETPTARVPESVLRATEASHTWTSSPLLPATALVAYTRVKTKTKVNAIKQKKGKSFLDPGESCEPLLAWDSVAKCRVRDACGYISLQQEH